MTYDATILATTGLTNYFKLGETSGSSTVADSQGSASGSVGTGVTLGNTGGVNDSSTCAYFPGANTSEYISLNQMLGPSGAASTNNRSVEFWIKPTGAPSAGGGKACIFCFGATNSGLDCLVNTTPDLCFFDPATSFSYLALGSLPYNSWYHIVFVFTQGQFVSYVNGNPTYSNNGGYLSTAPTGNSRIGADSSSNMFLGYIQKVAVYSIALSTATIQAHYVAGGGTAVLIRSAYNANGGAVPIQRTARATYNHQTQNVVALQRTIKTGLPGGGSPRPANGQMWPRGVAGR